MLNNLFINPILPYFFVFLHRNEKAVVFYSSVCIDRL